MTWLNFFTAHQKKVGKGEVVVRFYNNDLTINLLMDRGISPHDRYIASIAVDSSHRHENVGSSLLEEQIALAQRGSADRIYAHCWEGSYSPQLFAKLGFHPFLTVGPTEMDGLAKTSFGFSLQ